MRVKQMTKTERVVVPYARFHQYQLGQKCFVPIVVDGRAEPERFKQMAVHQKQEAAYLKRAGFHVAVLMNVGQS